MKNEAEAMPTFDLTIDQERSALAAIDSFSVVKAEIEERVKVYDALEIKDIDDAKGFAAVHEARMDLKKRRVSVEHRRKDLRAEHLRQADLAQQAAKTITAWITPGEERLAAKEKAHLDEKAKLKAEADERKRLELATRLDALAAVGSRIHSMEVEVMSEATYVETLGRLTAEFEEAARVEAEAEAKREADRVAEEAKAEAERVAEEVKRAEERAEAEALQAAEDARLKAENLRLKEAADKLEEDQKVFAAKELAAKEKKEREQAEADRLAEEAAEKLRVEARAKEEADAKAKADEAARIAEEERLARVEAAKPWLDRVQVFADGLEAFEVPGDLPDGLECEIGDVLSSASASIMEIARGYANL